MQNDPFYDPVQYVSLKSRIITGGLFHYLFAVF